MKAKDEKSRKIKLTLRNIFIIVAFIISILYVAIFYNLFFVKNKSYAKEANSYIEDIKISNAEKIDVEEYIEKNADENKKEEYTTEEMVLEYITKYQNSSSLPKGSMQVIQEGREGKQQITKKKTYINGELESEEQISSKVTKAAINKIVEIGTGNYKNNYKVKVGDTLYVTSDRLSVMVEPNDNSRKITTFSKNDKIKVLEILNDWYKVSSSNSVRICKIRMHNIYKS